jgi:hypothetical protein
MTRAKRSTHPGARSPRTRRTPGSSPTHTPGGDRAVVPEPRRVLRLGQDPGTYERVGVGLPSARTHSALMVEFVSRVAVAS